MAQQGKKSKVTDKRLARAIQFYNDYIYLGTLEKVAKKYGRTRERVRQILNSGSSAGFFTYPPEKPKLPSSVTAEQLRRDYILYGSEAAIAKHYGVRKARVSNTIRKYNLSLKELHLEKGRIITLKDYKKVVEELGHHPTATEMYQSTQGKTLCSRIQKYYGCMNTFRKTYGYPILKKGNPNFAKKKIQESRTNRENILKCVRIKPGITMPEIVNTLGIALEAVRLHLIKLKNEGVINKKVKGRHHYHFLKNPGKPTEKEKNLKLSDLKPPINSEDKAFIDRLSRLYLQHGDLNTVSKKMKKDKALLLGEIDRILKAGYLFPIKNRKALILSLRIKRDYDKIGRVDVTAKRYGVWDVVIGKYLRYGNKAGLFKHPDISIRKKYKITHISEAQDVCSKKNIEATLNIKKEYDSLGSAKKVAKKHGLSHEKIRQILMMGGDLGLFEFPPKLKKLYLRITKEKLHDDFLKYKSIYGLRKHYKVSIEQIEEAIRKHNISMPSITLESSRIKALKTYQDLVKELEHHPSTTEIKNRHGYLLQRIEKIWGSVYNFRKYYGFPNPKLGRKRKLLKNLGIQ